MYCSNSVVGCVLFTVIVLGTVHVCSGYGTKLIVKSDGPAILDSPIKFYASLANPDKSEYTISWLESYPYARVKQDVLNSTNNYTSSWTLTYWSKQKYEGNFTVTVSVYYYNFFYFNIIDTKIIYFTITDQFLGSLDVWQSGQLKKSPVLVTTKNETTLVANVHDPSKYLSTADNQTYSWYNKTHFIANTTTDELKYNFTREGQFYFNVTLSALFNTSINESTAVLKTGFFETNLTAKVGIVNLTVNGPTWFPHGKLLDLNVSCAGSGPYKYCWKLQTGPYNQTGNESCESPTVTNDCEFPITRYFQQPGIYTLLVLVTNQVSRVVSQSTINVYVVHRRQQLSIIVVPVSCSIIAIVLIVFGIAYYLEHQVKYTVEVANFDFGEDADLPYITFLERLRNSMQISNRSPAPLLIPPPTDEDDDDSMLTSN